MLRRWKVPSPREPRSSWVYLSRLLKSVHRQDVKQFTLRVEGHPHFRHKTPSHHPREVAEHLLLNASVDWSLITTNSQYTLMTWGNLYTEPVSGSSSWTPIWNHLKGSNPHPWGLQTGTTSKGAYFLTNTAHRLRHTWPVPTPLNGTPL